MGLSPPEPLSDRHQLDEFTSGVASLDDWLKRRARANQSSNASRTYVLADGAHVVGYHAIASGALQMEDAVGRFRRNMPSPIPVAILGRLAVHRDWQGQGLGRALFRDCAERVVHAASTLGIRGIVVHAISHDAKRFYEALGFEASPLDQMTLMVTLNDLRACLAR